MDQSIIITQDKSVLIQELSINIRVQDKSVIIKEQLSSNIHLQDKSVIINDKSIIEQD